MHISLSVFTCSIHDFMILRSISHFPWYNSNITCGQLSIYFFNQQHIKSQILMSRTISSYLSLVWFNGSDHKVAKFIVLDCSTSLNEGEWHIYASTKDGHYWSGNGLSLVWHQPITWMLNYCQHLLSQEQTSLKFETKHYYIHTAK